jgi:ATP-dependent Clp protease ATP-binding subunit ClpA
VKDIGGGHFIAPPSWLNINQSIKKYATLTARLATCSLQLPNNALSATDESSSSSNVTVKSWAAQKRSLRLQKKERRNGRRASLAASCFLGKQLQRPHEGDEHQGAIILVGEENRVWQVFISFHFFSV